MVALVSNDADQGRGSGGLPGCPLSIDPSESPSCSRTHIRHARERTSLGERSCRSAAGGTSADAPADPAMQEADPKRRAEDRHPRHRLSMEPMMPFTDRKDAGRRLAAEVARRTGARGADCVVVALPRGGVPVAAEIAAALDAPLDLVLVRKIGVPRQPELAMGAVAEGEPPLVERNTATMRLAGISAAEFDRVLEKELAEIERRRRAYLGGRPRISVAGKTAVVVDDGLATGASARAALRAVGLGAPQRLLLAVPVGATETLEAMRAEADDIICLEDYDPFCAIGLYYDDFRQVSDLEVKEILSRFDAGQFVGHPGSHARRA
ncbi:phosphoribosyltransferase [Jiella sp. M17.18]|uniref:phosphoribosyltransferase n=1 Tax=Jiella sp. M17.18 TaxID=3234247 RepID=UPI0034DEA92F